MQIIKNNPYRILGILVGATAKEKERQIKRLLQYIEVEQEICSDFSFPFLGTINRTAESIREADSQLNLDIDKVNAALFWFCNGNPIFDEPAFEALNGPNPQEAFKIWFQVIDKKDVSQKNWSAFHNLSTLMLSLCINGDKVKQKIFSEGLKIKIKFLESDFTRELIAKAVDSNYKITKNKIQTIFLSALQQDLEINTNFTPSRFYSILKNISFSAKKRNF